jgi:hypothetical protein
MGLVRGIMMAVGRIIRTLGTTGITVHLITGSLTMSARTMTIATPSMCSRHRVMYTRRVHVADYVSAKRISSTRLASAGNRPGSG